jgi:hypothetical protein
MMSIKELLCTSIICISIATAAIAQQIDAPQPQKGNLIGTVTDLNNDVVPGATVILEGQESEIQHMVMSNDSGFFELKNLEPGTDYHLTISASGFANWTSPTIILKPSQFLILTDCKLRVAEMLTTVNVVYSSAEIATEQVRQEEKQRVFGIIPNFYVVYGHDAEPLTTKLKFKLALRVSADPVTIAGVGLLASIDQAGTHHRTVVSITAIALIASGFIPAAGAMKMEPTRISSPTAR